MAISTEISRIICRNCRTQFEFTPSDKEFLQRVSPSLNGTLQLIPEPTLCPACRLQRRLSYRNEFNYYQGKCAKCSKSVVTVYAQPNKCPAYCHSCWWGESWDPLSSGLEYDPKRGFFEQFFELRSKVPQPAMMNDNGVTSENCEYCQDFAFGKNCYLCTAMWQCQDCLYCTQCNHVRDIVDSVSVSVESELVYQSAFCHKLYNCTFMSFSSGCSNCHFGMELKGCSDCLCCYGLRQKRFHIFNKQYSESEYRKVLSAERPDTFSGQQKILQQYREFLRQFPRRAVRQTNCEDCEGDNLFNCKSFVGRDMINGQYCKHAEHGDSPVNCHDVTHTGNPQWCYEGITPDNSYMTLFTTWCWKDRFVLYSDNCHSCEHLLGCIGLKRQRYCILNRQYSPSRYEELAAEIISRMHEDGEWGEFFPLGGSLFGYNESRAQDEFPLEKSEAEACKLSWRAEPERQAISDKVEHEDCISEVSDAILRETLPCDTCPKSFRIMPSELQFYRNMKLPLPRSCPSCRRTQRLEENFTSTLLHDRGCEKCAAPVRTIYPPQAKEKVVCEKCFMEVVA